MSEYDDDFDPDDFETPVIEEPVRVPETMKLTVEVGLTDYQPHGLLMLIAEAILRDIGGRDKWNELLRAYLLRLGKDRAESLVSGEIERIMREGIGALDLGEIVKTTAEAWAGELVRPHDGSPVGNDSFYRREGVPRLQWFVGNLVKEAMTTAWKEAEADWKAKTQAAIKSTLTEAMTEKLAKAFPVPPELRP